MPRVSVDVDVDLDEFDLDDLLDELEDRFQSQHNRNEILDWAKSVLKLELRNLSLLDQMKIDFLMNNLDKIKLNYLENLI